MLHDKLRILLNYIVAEQSCQLCESSIQITTFFTFHCSIFQYICHYTLRSSLRLQIINICLRKLYYCMTQTSLRLFPRNGRLCLEPLLH